MRVCNRWTAGETAGVVGAVDEGVEEEAVAGLAGGPAVPFAEVVANPAAGALKNAAAASTTAKSRRATGRWRGIAQIVAPAKIQVVLE